MREPQRGVAPLDGANIAQHSWWAERSGAVNHTYAEKLREQQQQGNHGGDLMELFDNHLADMDALKVAKPSADEFRMPHIRRLAGAMKVNPVHEATSGGPPLDALPQMPEPSFVDGSRKSRQTRRGRFLGRQRELASDEDDAPALPIQGIETIEPLSPSVVQAIARAGQDNSAAPVVKGRRSARNQAMHSERAASRATAAPAFEPDLIEPQRTTCLSGLWEAHGASWVAVNNCVVPSTFPQSATSTLRVGSTLESYRQTRTSSSIFDISYKVGLRVTGADREFVADQFLSCSLRNMRVGDVQYTCVIDSKGFMLDDAFVYVTDESVEILTSGCHARQLFDYLGHYVTYVRRSGADVMLSKSSRTAVVALQGPLSAQALTRAMNQLGSQVDGFAPMVLRTPHADSIPVAPSVLEAMPYMSFLSVHSGLGIEEGPGLAVLRVGSSGEDGFEIVGVEGDSLTRLVGALLDDDPMVRPAGVYCLDVLRMEAGLPRMGADVPSGTITPVRASLAWTLDQQKMRNHMVFGWHRFFGELSRGPGYRRVGLILDGPAHGGCRVLSNPHRQPIGHITSTAWSPALGTRVAMAYVKPEYAKANRHVLVTVPFNLPTHKMRRRSVTAWMRRGSLRSAYRSLVPACVAPLPFVPHSHPLPEKQRKATARLRYFAGVGAAAEVPTRGRGIPAIAAGVAERGRRPHLERPLPEQQDESDLLAD